MIPYMKDAFDFFLSLLNLTPTKILIGLLAIGLGAAIWRLDTISQDKDTAYATLVKENQELRTMVNTVVAEKAKSDVEAAKREIQIVKDCFEDKQKMTRQLDKELKKSSN